MSSIDICLRLGISGEGLPPIENLHAHLIVTPLNRVSLKIYIDINAERTLLEWIRSRPNYKEFARSITIQQIISPDYIDSIDLSNSSIALIGGGDNFNDHGGHFIGIDLKEVTVAYKLEADTGEYSGGIYLDNYAFDMANSLIKVDPFIADPKKWQSDYGARRRLFNNEFEFDFLEGISKDSFGYAQLISRLPRIVIFHKDTSYEDMLLSAHVVTSALSFFQGHQIEFVQLDYISGSLVRICYRPRKEKEKILRKDLGRFNIKVDVLSFIELLGSHLIEEQKLVGEIVRLFNLAIQMDGTSKFMLLFTIIEKLRNQLDPNAKKKEKFTFTNNALVNSIIREALAKVRNLVDAVQQSLFKEAEEDKLSTIKYLPQKEQFNGLFEKLRTDPTSYGLDFQQVVKIRGSIFHGKYYDSEDMELESINESLLQFTGNLVYCYLTMSYHDI